MKDGKKSKPVPTFRLNPSSLVGSEQSGKVEYGRMLGANANSFNQNLPEIHLNHGAAGEFAARSNGVPSPDTVDVTQSLSNAMSPVLSSMTNSPIVSGVVSPCSGLDYSMSELTEEKRRHHIRTCVKLRIFRKLKFFVKAFHNDYNDNPETVCADMMRYCHIVPGTPMAQLWWLETRKLVMRTHTDHRNNCIKAMRLRYRDPVLFNDKVLSQSDEAFMLLVFINYVERWAQELVRDKRKTLGTWTPVDEQNLPKPIYTFSRLKGVVENGKKNGGGSGWSKEGHERYNEIFRAVQEDRRLRASQFNPQLLAVFQTRRRGEIHDNTGGRSASQSLPIEPLSDYNMPPPNAEYRTPSGSIHDASTPV